MFFRRLQVFGGLFPGEGVNLFLQFFFNVFACAACGVRLKELIVNGFVQDGAIAE
jgi:hypothetical protein